MPRGGNNRKPTLQVIREGNPGRRPVAEGVVFPPSALTEPDWSDMLAAPEVKVAAGLWQRLAPTLARTIGLVGEQQELLADYCLTYARIRQGEQALGREGLVIPSARPDRGMVRNPWTTVLNQYRAHFRSLAAELGLTPSAASRLTRPPGADDDDDPFD